MRTRMGVLLMCWAVMPVHAQEAVQVGRYLSVVPVPAAVLARVEQRPLGLDIYLLDTRPTDDAAVRTWALERSIPFERVRARQITLNQDQGTAARLGFWQPAPFLAVATEDGARVIALADVR